MSIPVSVLNSYPPIDEAAVEALLAKELAGSRIKLVVLDDDPTGVQTVHDISVYTHWDEESILQAFEEEGPLFFVLTNSRGLTQDETTRVHHDLAAAVDAASKKTGKDYLYMSRSDSTLRGHYPLEPMLLKEDYEKYTGRPVDGEILCPFFPEGGRFTLGNVHYVKYGDELVPAGETEFAKDLTFGYKSSSLPEYIEEKTGGAYKAEDVVCISLEELHAMDIDSIERKLLAAENYQRIVLNAVGYADLKVFAVAFYRAIAQGKHFVFRCGAAIVKVLGGNTDQPLLTRAQMVKIASDHGGVIVIGSHTAKTTAQLAALKEHDEIRFIELDATLVRDEEAFSKEVARVLAEEEDAIRSGVTACCYTTRALISAGTGNKEDDLRLAVRISDAVQSLVGSLTVTPSFVIAKGGITSSDVGVKALGVKRALVLGQIRPGVPVWQTGSESRFPGIPYVIFPGNVGEDTTLREAYEILT